jgi:hypothetical protein
VTIPSMCVNDTRLTPGAMPKSSAFTIAGLHPVTLLRCLLIAYLISCLPQVACGSASWHIPAVDYGISRMMSGPKAFTAKRQSLPDGACQLISGVHRIDIG